jgi:hypothetical protein
MWKLATRHFWLRASSLSISLICRTALAQQPYGLDSREPIGPFLNNVMPFTAGAFEFPASLSATGAFSDVRNLTPATGVIPFTVNSPLWSDGAVKSRWIAVPNDGPPYTADEQIRFAPRGEWAFPKGTVFIKHFELTTNELTGERKRLETRLLVRDTSGAVYGITYKWRSDNSDADLLPGGLDEQIAITTTSGQQRVQTWSYPSRGSDGCLFCHNQPAKYVLGVKTHQLNGDFTYPSTGRTDNQLRTWAHLGMLNPTPNEASIATYLKSVSITNPVATIQHRMRSWIDSNCSQCHRPGGFCPQYDARFYTPLNKQNLINTYVKFRDLAGSQLYQRDNSLEPTLKMPPLAKNVVHQAAMAVLRQWIASPLEMLSVYLSQDTEHIAVRFNSHVDPTTAPHVSNYSLDQGAIVSKAKVSQEPDTVILTVSPLVEGQSYVLTTTGVQDTAPSANTIWPSSRMQFRARFMPNSNASRLANASGRVRVGAGDEVAVEGFIVLGASTKRVMIRAIGPSLGPNGISPALADPVLELHDRTGAIIAANDNWADNANQQEIIDTGLAPQSVNESVILMKLRCDQAGVPYTAVLRGANNTTGVALLEIYDLDKGVGSRVLNTSTRGWVGSGDDVLIGGVIVGQQNSTTNLRVVVRAIGPSLTAYGIANPLQDPTLAVYDGNGNRIVANDNWRDTQETELRATRMQPSYDTESALVRTLPPGNYTIVVSGKSDASGVGLVEVYAVN